MRITFLTLFPEYYDSYINSVLVKRAREMNIVHVEVIDIKQYAGGSFRHIDESPYGGGAGMVIRCEPVMNALNAVKQDNSKVYLLDPAGITLTQKDVHEFSKIEHMILIAGHYEGFDARIYDAVDGCISIGDYVLSGGEFASMIISDAIIRLQEGIIRSESTMLESFENHRLDYLSYTKPYDYNGKTVPDVLLSGNHEEIRKYRQRQSLERTIKLRPDLIEKYPLTEDVIVLLQSEDLQYSGKDNK